MMTRYGGGRCRHWFGHMPSHAENATLEAQHLAITITVLCGFDDALYKVWDFAHLSDIQSQQPTLPFRPSLFGAWLNRTWFLA